MKSAFLCTAALLLAACYASTGRHGNLDGGEDPSPADIRPDDGREDGAADAEAEGYVFVDRDTPDRNIPVRLLFAELPSIAWNGTAAGIAYIGMPEGVSDNVIGFIPLDAFGNVAGDEKVILDTGGLWGSIPKLSGDGDGFLFCTLDESTYDSIVVLSLSAGGEMLARGTTPAASNIVSPVSAPVRLADSVFVATTSYEDIETNVLYRFTYPSLSYELEFTTGVEADWPILRKTPGADTLLLFYKVPSGALMVDEVSPDLEILRTFQVPREEPFVDYTAATSSREWYAWFASTDSDGSQFTLETVSAGGLSSYRSHPADFYSYFMSSTASDVPSSFGAVFSLFNQDPGRWDLHAILDALPEPDYLVDADVIVNDLVEDRTMEDGIHADIAWTEGGFLVVWDEWRAPYNYTLFSSFLALEAEP